MVAFLELWGYCMMLGMIPTLVFIHREPDRRDTFWTCWLFLVWLWSLILVLQIGIPLLVEGGAL